METRILDANDAKALIERIGDKLGSDMTYAPQFVEGRQDVCVVRHTSENGTTYGYDTLFLIWADKDGKLHFREIVNTRRTKDYVFLKTDKPLTADGDVITVHYGSPGAHSGKRWEDVQHIRIT